MLGIAESRALLGGAELGFGAVSALPQPWPPAGVSLSPLLLASVWSLIRRPAMGLGLGCVFPQPKFFQQLSGACDAAVCSQEVTSSREKSGLWLVSYPWRRVSRCSEGEAGPVPGFSQVSMVLGPAHLHCHG